MTAFVFANYVDTTLAAATSSTATSLSLSSSANLPVLGPGEIMPLTLNDAATGLVYEIVYVTAISGTTLTVLRGQEGTAAQNWSSGDYAFVSPTADTVSPVVGTYSPVASETLPAVNRLVVTPGTLTADIDLTLNDAAAAGSGATIYGSASDYTATVQSPVTTGSPYIELPDGSQVYSWTIPAASPSQGIRVDWDGANWRARTFGQAVVAPATADNEAVNQGQLTNGSFTPRFSQIARQSSQNNQNWLPNSSFLYGFAGWDNSAGLGIANNDNFTYADYGRTDTSTQYLTSGNLTADPLTNSGQVINLSGWIYNGTASASATLALNCYESDGTLISTIASSSLSAGNGWTYVTNSGTIPSGTTYVQVACGFAGASSGTNISFSQIKLESGDTPTQWSDESSAELFQNTGLFSPTFNGLTLGGNATITGTASATAGTSGNELVNYTQMTNGSIGAEFSSVTATGAVQAWSGGLPDSTSGIVVGTISSNDVAGIIVNTESGYGNWLEQLMVDGTIMWRVDASGNAVAVGTVSAAAGTSGNELVNYTQMTNGSLSPSFGETAVASATASGQAPPAQPAFHCQPQGRIHR